MPTTKWDLSCSEQKLEELTRLLDSRPNLRPLVLCHNNPDPDTIAGTFAMSFLLSKKFGIRTTLGYGGVISRAENKAMVERLKIKMMALKKVSVEKYESILLIDAQPGSGNNLLISRASVPLVVIDHHPLRKRSQQAAFNDIRPNYGSTATIITEYILAAGLKPTTAVANALLYGLKTDTNSLIRGACKADHHAFNYLIPLTNPKVIGLIEKPELPIAYFEEYYRGLANALLYKDVAVSNIGKIKTESIIPELSDVLLRVEGVNWSLCLGEIDDQIVLSLRSKSRTLKAGNILVKLLGKFGSAGGHREMAGGQAPLVGLNQAEQNELSTKLVNDFLKIIKRSNANPKKLVVN
ncbi:MAG: DHH family phosphoesterase [Syntrophaceae bacterium]|nr:DHH family phosphoesterase [Syntrophaceae bacterium]